MSTRSTYEGLLCKSLAAVMLAVFVSAAVAQAATTFTWDGGGSDNRWLRYNNWLKNGSASHQQRPEDNDDIAAVKFISGRKNNPRLEASYTIRMLRFLNSSAVTINDDAQWNSSNGNNRRTLTITGHQIGSDWTVVDVDSNPGSTVTHTIAPGVRILVNSNRYWDIGGDEILKMNGRVSGTGNLIKKGTGTLIFQKRGIHLTQVASTSCGFHRQVAGTVQTPSQQPAA